MSVLWLPNPTTRDAFDLVSVEDDPIEDVLMAVVKMRRDTRQTNREIREATAYLRERRGWSGAPNDWRKAARKLNAALEARGEAEAGLEQRVCEKLIAAQVAHKEKG
jgi:hypothetical protein